MIDILNMMGSHDLEPLQSIFAIYDALVINVGWKDRSILKAKQMIFNYDEYKS